MRLLETNVLYLIVSMCKFVVCNVKARFLRERFFIQKIKKIVNQMVLVDLFSRLSNVVAASDCCKRSHAMGHQPGEAAALVLQCSLMLVSLLVNFLEFCYLQIKGFLILLKIYD